jgi:hypothetical protein
MKMEPILSEAEVEMLWSRVNNIVCNKERQDQLMQKFDDPILAAKSIIDETESKIVDNYGEQKGKEILRDVRSLSRYGPQDGKLLPTGDLVNVSATGFPDPKDESLGRILCNIHNRKEISIFEYLQLAFGMSSEGIKLLNVYSNFYKLYDGIVSQLLKTLRNNAIRGLSSPLPEALQTLDSLSAPLEYLSRIDALPKPDGSFRVVNYSENRGIDFHKSQLKQIIDIIRSTDMLHRVSSTNLWLLRDLSELGILKKNGNRRQSTYVVNIQGKEEARILPTDSSLIYVLEGHRLYENKMW